MTSIDPQPTNSAPPERRGVPALAVLFTLVAGGVGVGAGYYRWAQPRAAAKTEQVLAQFPGTLEGRVQLWVDHASPILHERLCSARISKQQPWVVTHQVVDPSGGPPQVFGIPTDEISRDLATGVGTVIHIQLPAPRALAQTTLVGDHARSVLTVAEDEEVDPREILVRIGEYALRFQAEKLEKDLPGATLVIDVAPGA